MFAGPEALETRGFGGARDLAAACGLAQGPKLIPNSAIFMLGRTNMKRCARRTPAKQAATAIRAAEARIRAARSGNRDNMRCPQCGFDSAPDAHSARDAARGFTSRGRRTSASTR